MNKIACVVGTTYYKFVLVLKQGEFVTGGFTNAADNIFLYLYVWRKSKLKKYHNKKLQKLLKAQ